MGKIEWAAEYPGFGLTGCVSLPFIAAAKAPDRFFDHVAICIDGSGALFSLEPGPGDSGPNPLIRTTIDDYLRRSDNPDHGCVICPFPF